MSRGLSWLLVSPSLLLVALIFLLPFALLILMSLWSQPPGSLLLDPTPTLVNYQRLFADGFYLRAIATTLALSGASVVLCLALAVPLAYWISRRAGRTRSLLVALVLIPLICGALLPTLGLMNLLGPLGVINGTLRSLGLITKAIGFLGTPGGIIIGLVQGFLPFAVLPLVQGFDQLPVTMERAAASLGASRLLVWRRIILPLVSPALMAGGLLVFCAALTAFVTPQILGQGKIATFGTVVYQQAIQVLDWPFASALAVLMLVIMAAAWGAARFVTRVPP